MSPSGLVNGPALVFRSKNVPFLTAFTLDKFINNQLLLVAGNCAESVNILCR